MPAWLSYIDIGFTVVVLLFAWGGFQKGFAGQVAHILAALFLGGALFFAFPAVYGYLGRVFRRIDETYIMWMLVIILVILSVLVFIGISKLLVNLLKLHITEKSDQVNGLLLGTVRGILTALLGMILLVMLGPYRIEESFRYRSYTGRFVVHELVPRIRPHVSREIWKENAEKVQQRLQEERDKTTRARNLDD